MRDAIMKITMHPSNTFARQLQGWMIPYRLSRISDTAPDADLPF